MFCAFLVAGMKVHSMDSLFISFSFIEPLFFFLFKFSLKLSFCIIFYYCFFAYLLFLFFFPVRIYVFEFVLFCVSFLLLC